MEKNIVATYLVIDAAGDDTRVANVRGKTSSKRFQSIYWKCVVSLYISLISTNKNVEMIFFTNLKESPIVEGIDIFKKLEYMNVKVVNLEFKNKMPNKWYHSWTNQFYMFDVMEYMRDNFIEPFNFLLLDSDCVVTQNIDDIFEDIKENGILCYDMECKINQNVNGTSIEEMVQFYNKLYSEDISYMKFVGGEFIGFNRQNLGQFLENYYIVRKNAIESFKKGEFRPITEEHFFSIILQKLNGYTNHRYIKRISLFKNYNNYMKNDEEHYIWHLPSEKTRGFNIMFKKYKNKTGEKINKDILKRIFIHQNMYKDLIQIKEKLVLRIIDIF